MVDCDIARKRMVDSQLRPNDITDANVIDAFSSVPRERFVPSSKRKLAYIDDDIQIRSANEMEEARYIMAPMPLGKLIQLAEITPQDVVLVIGCGSGYCAAILSRLASSVVALEEDVALAKNATEALIDIDASNVAVVSRPLEQGLETEGPYDVILINGAVEAVPQALFGQLKENGRLVAVIGTGGSGEARVFTVCSGVVSSRFVFNVNVRSLPGFSKEEFFEF